METRKREGTFSSPQSKKQASRAKTTVTSVKQLELHFNAAVQAIPGKLKSMKEEDDFEYLVATGVPVSVYNAFLEKVEPRVKLGWEDGTVKIRSVPGFPHEGAVKAIESRIGLSVNFETEIQSKGAARFPGRLPSEREADASFASIPKPLGIAREDWVSVIVEVDAGTSELESQKWHQDWFKHKDLLRAVVGIRFSKKGRTARAWLYRREVNAVPLPARGQIAQEIAFGLQEAQDLNGPGLPNYQIHLPLEDLFGGAANVPQHYLQAMPATPGALLPRPEALPHLDIDLYLVRERFLHDL